MLLFQVPAVPLLVGACENVWAKGDVVVHIAFVELVRPGPRPPRGEAHGQDRKGVPRALGEHGSRQGTVIVIVHTMTVIVNTIVVIVRVINMDLAKVHTEAGVRGTRVCCLK